MTGTPLDWFPFFAERFLASKANTTMTAEQVGMFCRLLARQWLDGPLPAETEELVCLSGGTAEALPRVLRQFTKTEDGYINEHLAGLRVEAEERVNSASEKGKMGAKKRWRGQDKRDANGMPGQCPGNAQAMPGDSSEPLPLPIPLPIHPEEQNPVAPARDRDPSAGAKKAEKEAAALAEYRAWAAGLEGKDGNPPEMVRAYIRAMEQAVEEFYERNDGSFTALKKARFAKRMGRFGADHQLLAIEIYVDAYAGKRPEAYIVGIADKKRRLSRQELEAEWVRHRRSMNGMGLSDLVEA